MLAVVLVAGFPAAACLAPQQATIQDMVASVAQPYAFNLWQWEAGAVGEKLRPGARESLGEAEAEATVVRYFVLAAEKRSLLSREPDAAARKRIGAIGREQSALAGGVEVAMQQQVGEALLGAGITNPFPLTSRLHLIFPPVVFQLESPPRLLVISPRERIGLVQRITLRQDLSPEEVGEIESSCDRLGVSALVEDLGGLATYPSIVSEDSGLRYTLETVSEEWVHQYLSFRPFGFAYVLDILGIRKDSDVVTLNETAAGMISEEMADRVVEDHYAPYVQPGGKTRAPDVSGFSFNREMRITRQKTDELLASGQVGAAEKYMEERRRFLADHGYYIRKLNQAYFAFHGTYAYSPAAVSPIYADLQKVRARSSSLREFVEVVSAMTSYRDLQAVVGR